MKWRVATMGVLFVSQAALAHQPTVSDGTATEPDSAIRFGDIQLSRVVYHEVTEQAPTLWITFEIDGPQSLWVSLGLPLINRLKSFRPAFVVLGPGLPDIDLPFETPEGVGGVLFETDQVAEPRVFYEPFSRTSSWILREEDVDLPQAGTYYLVAFVPTGEKGKLWLAPGKREEFSLADIAELRGVLDDVRAFHETSAAGPPCALFPLAAMLLFIAALRLVGNRPNK